MKLQHCESSQFLKAAELGGLIVWFRLQTIFEVISFLIDDQPSCIESIHSADRIIYKDPKRLYVLKVAGTSMNNTKPAPINNGGYVLVYETNTPEKEDIVAQSFLIVLIKELP